MASKGSTLTRFVSLKGEDEGGNSKQQLQGIVFDVDGTLWYVMAYNPFP